MFRIDEENVGHDSGTIMSKDTDRYYEAKLPFYFGLSQEMGGVHANHLGCGLKEMFDNEGRTWMILRTQMKIGRLASWTEEYSLDTWCQQGYLFYCPRIVQCHDKDGGLLFESMNHWVIMNVEKGRPERPSYLDGRFAYPDKEKHWQDPALPKFPKEEEYDGESFPSHPVTISWYDYDYNRHVNNISYVSWLIDSFPEEYLNTHRPELVDVEWKKQCHFGDELYAVTTRKAGTDEFYTKVVRKTEDGEEIAFHATTTWATK